MDFIEKHLKPRAIAHDNEHSQNAETFNEEDLSCIKCNMVRTTPGMDFWNFLGWYRRKTGAIVYTEQTIKRFYEKREFKEGESHIQRWVGLIESMRYEGKAKYETANELIQVMVQKWIEYQGFKMEIIDDNVSEVSEKSETLSIISITSSMENEDKIEETEQFTKFWELFKTEFKNVISYKKITVESFEKLMEINYEEMNKENIRKIGEGLSYLVDGLKFRRLIPNRDRIIQWLIDILICSKKFTLSIEETQRNYTKVVTKSQENKERALLPDLSSVEKFLILYQNEVPEIEEINEEKVKKALEELLQLEYTASGKQVKAAQMRIIRAIRYEPAIVESEERDRIRYILTCSNGLTLNIQQTQKNIRKYVAGSNVTTSEETSPEKVKSPEKKESDEEDDSEEKKEEIKDKGKGKIGDKKKEEIIDRCKRCNKSWKDCTCQCRKHGNILDCGIEYDEECYYITIEEYKEYQKKSSIFQTLVKIGTYKWNGETYKMINKTKELEDSEEEEENKGTIEEQENMKPTIEDTYENIEYEEAETSTRDRTENWVEKERQRMKEEH